MKKQLVKLMTVCAMLSSMLFTANAQDTPKPQAAPAPAAARPQVSPEQRAEMRAQRMKQMLTLTDEQTAKVKDIYAASDKTRPTNAEEAKASRDKVNTEIEKVLTPEQLTKFKAMQQPRPMNNTPGGATPPPAQKTEPAPVKK